jgi:hypothetical protein
MDKEIYRLLVADTSKNFVLDTVEGDFDVENFFELFREKLIAHLFELLQTDYNRLQLILYRVDVDEKTFKMCLEEPKIHLVADRLADAVIARLVQKIEYRTGRR